MLGRVRFPHPMDDASRKRFVGMSALGPLFAIGYSKTSQARRFSDGGVEFYMLPAWPVSFFRQSLYFLGGLLLVLWVILRHQVNVIISQGPYDGVPAALAKRLVGFLGRSVRLVVESHGDFEESAFAGRRVRCRGIRRRIMAWSARYALESADVLRSISAFTTSQLQHYAPTKPIIQFPAWTDIGLFLRQDARRKREGPRTLLYAGSLRPLKGVHHLIGAFSRAFVRDPSLRLALIGSPDDADYSAQLRRQVCDLRLEREIRFLAPVSQEVLAERMAASEAFVLPSLSEGLGRVVLEAMAAGTPVIGSRVGGIPDLIRHDETGYLVEPGDEQALADRILWVLQHPDQVAAVCLRAREFAAAAYSSAMHMSGYRQLLDACAQSP